MVELLFWRHAKTERGHPPLTDRQRALLPLGREDAREMGRVLAREGLCPQVILCSDAVRARETADEAISAFVPEPDRYDLPELYDTGAGDYRRAIGIYGGSAQRLMVVGHNPDMESFVSAVAGNEVNMKAGMLAVIEADADHAGQIGSGTAMRLRSLLVPSRLRST